MNRIDELREQIDACRAGSDDLHLPELAGLARAVGQEGVAAEAAVARELDRSQRLDRNVVSALHDVSVPAGLLERLLSKTAAVETGDSSDALLSASVSKVVGESVAGESVADEPAVIAPARSELSRRGWLLRAGSLGVVAAGLLGLAVVLWPTQPRTVSQAELASEIPSWVLRTQDRTPWNNMQTPPPAVFKLSADWVRWSVAWRSVQTSGGESAVAYELKPGGGKVLLFVVKTPHKYAVPAIPVPLPGTTGGVQISAWQSPTGGLLFVLFIDRGGPQIDQYLPHRTEA